MIPHLTEMRPTSLFLPPVAPVVVNVIYLKAPLVINTTQHAYPSEQLEQLMLEFLFASLYRGTFLFLGLWSFVLRLAVSSFHRFILAHCAKQKDPRHDGRGSIRSIC